MGQEDQHAGNDMLSQVELLETTCCNKIPDILIFKDADGRWLLANDLCLKYLSLPDDTYKGKTDVELAAEFPRFKDIFLHCAQTDTTAWKHKVPATTTQALTLPDGISTLFELTAIPFFNTDGNRQALLLTGSQVIGLRREQQRIARQRQITANIVKVHRLFREQSSEKLLMQKICDCLVKAQACYSAWILLLDKAGVPAVIVSAGIPPLFDFAKEDFKSGQLPQCMQEVMNNRRIHVCQDVQSLCRKCIIGKHQQGKGIISSPIQYADTLFGVLAVALPMDFIGLREEDAMFVDLAQDIGYGIYNRRQEAKRCEMERSLQERIDFLQKIYNAADTVSFITTDTQGRDAKIIEFSSGSEKMFGYSRSEVIGQPVALLHLKEDAEKFPEALERNARQEKGFNGQVTLVRKSGEKFPALLTTYPLNDQNGRMQRSLGVCVDISKQKRHENELELFANISRAFAISDQEQMFVDVLNVILKHMESPYGIFGYLQDEGTLVCFSLETTVREQCSVGSKSMTFSDKQWTTSWKQALEEGETSCHNGSLTVPEGQLPMTSSLVAPVRYQEKVIGLLQVANRENGYGEEHASRIEKITLYIAPILHAKLEEQKSIDLLKESERNLKTAQRIARLGHWELDVATNQFVASDETYRILRVKDRNTLVCRQDFIQFVHPDDREKVLHQFYSAMRNGDFYENTSRAVLADGTLKYLHMNFFVQKGRREGKPLRFSGTLQDITMQKNMEKRLIHTEKMATVAGLAAGVAHEIIHLCPVSCRPFKSYG